MERILIIGAAGQIGSELTIELRKNYGSDNVFATDIKEASRDIMDGGPFQLLDVMDDKRLIHFIIRHKITRSTTWQQSFRAMQKNFPCRHGISIWTG